MEHFVHVLLSKHNFMYSIQCDIQHKNVHICHIQDAERTAQFDLALAQLSGFMYGVKLVRGAYMEQEREKARKEGYESPIWSTKEETDACYHQVLDTLLKEVATPSSNVHVMVASHNPDTIKFATERYV